MSHLNLFVSKDNTYDPMGLNLIINYMIILTLILTPLLGSLFIYAYNPSQNKSMSIKKIALITTLCEFIIGISLWISFDYNTSVITYMEIVSNIRFGIDNISLLFIILTVFIMPICILADWESNQITKLPSSKLIAQPTHPTNTLGSTIITNGSLKERFIWILVLESIFIIIFTSQDILIFYIFFESSLIPMFFLIGLYGSKSNLNLKYNGLYQTNWLIYATYQFFIMTFAGSLLMLLAILYLYIYLGTTDYLLISTSAISYDVQCLIWLGFFIAFATKAPLMPFHQWLPLAHTEAPLTGSIILAALMLKLATFGFIKYSIALLPYASTYFTPLIMTLGLISLIYSSITTLRQIDIKKIIAYSSIGHMAIIIMALFSNSYQGLSAALFFSVAHGLTSSGLFICVTILYSIFHTRNILYFKGLSNLMPLLSLFCFIFILSNMSIPLTCNFIGEFLSFIGIFKFNFSFTAILAAISILLVPIYSILFFNRSFFGSYSLFLNYNVTDISFKQFHLILPLLFSVLFTGLFPDTLTGIYEFSISMSPFFDFRADLGSGILV